MADQDPQDIADALAALSSGSHAEEPTSHDVQEEPAATAPAPRRPPSKASLRAATPVSPPPSRAPSSRRAESPLAPPPPSAEQVDSDELGSLRSAAVTTTSSAILARATATNASLKKRRTMIPILLTCGVLLLVFSSLKFVMGVDSPFSNYGSGTLGVAAGAGVLLLGAGVALMLGVRSELTGTAGR